MVRVLLVSWLLMASLVSAEEKLTVAVTASFRPVLELLAAPFYSATGVSLVLSSASTGVLHQQVISGAPFDVFLAADRQHPQALILALNLPSDSVVTYALGQLVLVSTDENVRRLEDLNSYKGRLIIANPTHAPFGTAAIQALKSVSFQGEIIYANNVSQARQYLSLKLAKVGLVSSSVAQGFDQIAVVDPAQYDVIEHQLVRLTDSAKADAFIAFLAGNEAQTLMLDQGYLIPGEPQP